MDSMLPLVLQRDDFSLLMSQDGVEPGVADFVRQHYVIPGHAQHVQKTERAMHLGRFANYKFIADHFRFALHHVFEVLQFDTAVILEDDLLVAPDLLDFFSALAPVLHSDKSLLCVSAWNDNGFEGRVSDEQAAELRRTSVFPGMGWMLTRSLWLELKDKWPSVFWDDWLREPQQSRGRDCIYPTVSRTQTFGRKGASGGQFAEYLERTVLSSVAVKWDEVDLTSVERDRFKRNLLEQVNAAQPVSLTQLRHADETTDVDVRILYKDARHYKQIADVLQIMNDEKGGRPRTSFEGIVRVLTVRGASLFIVPS